MATPIAVFNNKLIEFVEDLTESYPEEKEIRNAVDALKAIKRMNPKLLHSGFMEYVYPEFHTPVMNEDEVSLIKTAHSALHGEHSEYSFAYIIFDRHWTGMSDDNKKAIWNYCKVLVILAERAAGIRA
jgi:hypothetical protein